MDSKEILGLMEAYSEVYAPKENGEQLDELAPLVAGGLALGGAALAAKAIADRMSANRKKVTSSTPSAPSAKPSLSGAVQRRNQQMADVLKQSYEMDGELVDENIDIYDIILSYLLGEGFVETKDAAVAVMANMSEEWKNSIIEEIKVEFNEDVRNRDVSSRGGFDPRFDTRGDIKHQPLGTKKSSRWNVPSRSTTLGMDKYERTQNYMLGRKFSQPAK